MPDDDPYSTPVGQPDQYDEGGGLGEGSITQPGGSLSGGVQDLPSSQPQSGGSDTSSSGGSAPAKQKVDKDGLPDFDNKKSYLVKGSTLNAFKTLIKRNNPKAVTGGGLKEVQQTSDGKFWALDADQLTLSVCINGVATTKTFYVKRSSGT